VTRGVSSCSAKLTRRDRDLISIGAPVSIQYCDLRSSATPHREGGDLAMGDNKPNQQKPWQPGGQNKPGQPQPSTPKK